MAASASARQADLAASRFLAAGATLAMILALSQPVWRGGLPAVAGLALLALLTLSGWRALALARAQGRRGRMLAALTLSAGAALGAWLGWWLWLAPPWAGAALALHGQSILMLAVRTTSPNSAFCRRSSAAKAAAGR